MGRRTWIKIFSDNWLRGSIRKEAPEIRCVWIDLLALAGDSAYGDDGIIQLADDIGLSDDIVAGILNIHMDIWLAAKDRLSNHPNPKENRIRITPLKQEYAIKILNWSKYQSEYERQKKYRGKKGKSPEKTKENEQSYNHGYNESYGEKEMEMEKEPGAKSWADFDN